MVSKSYGINKLMYRVVEREKDCIQLQVHHTNNSMREEMRRNLGNPRHFWESRQDYRDHTWAAKKRLAEVIDDYPTCFENGRVEIIFVRK